MLYHPAKVPAMYFSLSLDSTWAHCDEVRICVLKISYREAMEQEKTGYRR